MGVIGDAPDTVSALNKLQHEEMEASAGGIAFESGRVTFISHIVDERSFSATGRSRTGARALIC